MFVACSTLCFSKEPLESALRHIAELEFDKIELAIVEGGTHLRPSEVAENPEAAAAPAPPRAEPDPRGARPRLRRRRPDGPVLRKRFEAMCRLAKPLTVAVLTIPAAPLGTPFDDEVKRLSRPGRLRHARGPGPGRRDPLRDPDRRPGRRRRALQGRPRPRPDARPQPLHPGPAPGGDFDAVYPYVQNVHLRDTGKGPGEFQVRVGQGEIEYGRIVNLLERHGYDRGLTVSILDRLDNPFDVEVEVRKLKLLLESLI